ncbi:unnamed protein product [Discula destructiva]
MPDSLDIQLQNQTKSHRVWAYVTGIAISNGQRVLLKANGRDLYYPQQVSQIGTPLAEDCAIPLGPPGSTASVRIPQMAGGRVWFSCEQKLQFLLNPGPALVEPSVLNPSDPNAGTDFCFAEFTLNNDQLFANISYVDFVSRLPIALTLETSSGGVQHVSGMGAGGIDKICNGLQEQARKDGRPWDKLIVQPDGQQVLRVLSPTHGDAVGASFAGYFEAYINEVWLMYSGHHAKRQMRINTQAAAGIVTGSVNHKDELVFGEEAFTRPTTADVLGCNSGPFTTGPSPYRNSIIPRLAAGFQRSAFGESVDEHPSDPSTFFQREPTNHYCRIVHEANLDGKGYAFAYDDVQPNSGADQSGKVNAGDPKTFIIALGGRDAYVGDRMPGSHHASHQHPPPVDSAEQHQGHDQQQLQQQQQEEGSGSPESRLGRYSAKAQKWLKKRLES